MRPGEISKRRSQRQLVTYPRKVGQHVACSKSLIPNLGTLVNAIDGSDAQLPIPATICFHLTA
jgi:hypothetical protein